MTTEIKNDLKLLPINFAQDFAPFIAAWSTKEGDFYTVRHDPSFAALNDDTKFIVEKSEFKDEEERLAAKDFYRNIQWHESIIYVIHNLTNSMKENYLNATKIEFKSPLQILGNKQTIEKLFEKIIDEKLNTLLPPKCEIINYGTLKIDEQIYNIDISNVMYDDIIIIGEYDFIEDGFLNSIPIGKIIVKN